MKEKKEEKIDKNILFWVLLGPLFLLTTLFLTSFAPIPSKDLFVFSLLAIVFCQKKKQTGLFYSLLALVILSFYKHFFQISQGHLWQLGIEFSLSLGIFISYFSFEHASDIIKSYDLQKNTQNESLEKMEQELKKEADFHSRQHKNFQYEIDRVNFQLEEKNLEIGALKKLAENLRGSLKDIDLEKERILKEAKEKEKQIALLRETIDEYKEQVQTLMENESFEELNNLKIEKEKIESFSKIIERKLEEKTLLHQEKEAELKKMLVLESEYKNKIEKLLEEKQNLENLLQKEKETALNEKNNTEISPEEKMSYESKISELKKIQSLYSQLKVQFEEKKKLLEETRKELFRSNEKISSFDKVKELQALDETVLEKDLTLQLGSFESETKRLEEENIHLHDIVSALTKQIDISSEVPTTKEVKKRGRKKSLPKEEAKEKTEVKAEAKAPTLEYQSFVDLP